MARFFTCTFTGSAYCSHSGSASSATASRSRCRSGRASSSRSTISLAEIRVRRRPLVLRTGVQLRDRLRHRAGEEAVERKPGLPRAVRARPDRLDPAQGGRSGAGPGSGVTPGSLGGDGSTPEGGAGAGAGAKPDVVEDAAAAEETHGVTAFATELATQFHAFYRDARVVDPSEPERSRSRLALVRATQITLAERAGPHGDLAPEAM